MNQTYIHLFITHLPIFGSVLGGIVLGYGLWTKSLQTKLAAYYLFIISSIGAGVAYLTGEAAEETVEHIQGISKTVIDAHEDLAVIALISSIILGITSVGGIVLALNNPANTKATAVVILFISLITFGLAARTGYLGGKIRHTEISSPANSGPEQSDESDDD